MIDNSFIARRLEQLPPMGGTIIHPGHHNGFHEQFEIQSVMFNNKEWTRVTRQLTGQVLHYEGYIIDYAAANYAAADFKIDEYAESVDG